MSAYGHRATAAAEVLEHLAVLQLRRKRRIMSEDKKKEQELARVARFHAAHPRRSLRPVALMNLIALNRALRQLRLTNHGIGIPYPSLPVTVAVKDVGHPVQFMQSSLPQVHKLVYFNPQPGSREVSSYEHALCTGHFGPKQLDCFREKSRDKELL